MNKCWICGTPTENAGFECPKCGPAQPWGPTAQELAMAHQILEEGLCEECGKHPKVSPESDWMCDWLCEECNANRAEAAYERQQEEGFRGTEKASYDAEQQAWIQRNLK